MHAPVAIVLAAGKGTRMGSDLPKVLHRLADEPLVAFPVRAALAAGVERVVVVVGHGGEQVRAAVADASPGAAFAEQHEQRGTGHAVLCALPAIAGAAGPVLILSGDVPLLAAATLRRLVDAAARGSSGLALATFRPADPTGYGRILRDRAGRVVGIREERDSSPAEREIRECNAGVYCVDAGLLREELPAIGTDNAQGEIYLTDLVGRAAARGEVVAVEVDAVEVAGVNTREHLAELEAIVRARVGAAGQGRA